MFGNQELTQLEARKAELLAQSEAIRGNLRANWAQLQPAVSWVERGVSLARAARPFFPAGAALLGILAAGRSSVRPRRWRFLRLGWRLVRVVPVVWRGLCQAVR